MFEVDYCGICVGEVKVYDWGDWAASDPTLDLPTVMGREAAVVADLGSGVKGLSLAYVTTGSSRLTTAAVMAG